MPTVHKISRAHLTQVGVSNPPRTSKEIKLWLRRDPAYFSFGSGSENVVVTGSSSKADDDDESITYPWTALQRVYGVDDDDTEHNNCVTESSDGYDDDNDDDTQQKMPSDTIGEHQHMHFDTVGELDVPVAEIVSKPSEMNGEAEQELAASSATTKPLKQNTHKIPAASSSVIIATSSADTEAWICTRCDHRNTQTKSRCKHCKGRKGGIREVFSSSSSCKSPAAAAAAAPKQHQQEWKDMFDCLVKFIKETREKSTQHMDEAQKSAWIWDGNVPTSYKTPCGKALGRWMVINTETPSKIGGAKGDARIKSDTISEGTDRGTEASKTKGSATVEKKAPEKAIAQQRDGANIDTSETNGHDGDGTHHQHMPLDTVGEFDVPVAEIVPKRSELNGEAEQEELAASSATTKPLKQNTHKIPAASSSAITATSSADTEAWICTRCDHRNTQTKSRCKQCKGRKGGKREGLFSSSSCKSPAAAAPKQYRREEWEDMFDCLVKFVKETREKSTQHMDEAQKSAWIWDGNVPTSYKTPCGKALGRWISNQRSHKAKGMLKDDREVRLFNTGLKWSVLTTRHTWRQMFRELEIYVEEQTKDGRPWDGNVPTNFKIKSSTTPSGNPGPEDDDKKLGRWVARHRILFRTGKLKKERQRDLERIGLKWSVLLTTSRSTMSVGESKRKVAPKEKSVRIDRPSVNRIAGPQKSLAAKSKTSPNSKKSALTCCSKSVPNKSTTSHAFKTKQKDEVMEPWTCTRCGRTNAFTKSRCKRCKGWKGGSKRKGHCSSTKATDPLASIMKRSKTTVSSIEKADADDMEQLVTKQKDEVMEPWTCTRCGRTNAVTKSRCKRCKGWKEGKRKGHCSSTKATDPLASIRKRPKTKVSSIEKADADDMEELAEAWECTRCKYNNTYTKSRCASCRGWKGGKREGYSSSKANDAPVSITKTVNTSASNGKPDNDTEDLVEAWECTRCKYNNKNTKSRCGSCQGWKGGKREGYSPTTATDVSTAITEMATPLIFKKTTDGDAEELGEEWKCAKCGRNNTCAKSHCQRCQGPKGGKRKECSLSKTAITPELAVKNSKLSPEQKASTPPKVGGLKSEKREGPADAPVSAAKLITTTALKELDEAWKCIRCGRANAVTRSRCKRCKGWKQGKRQGKREGHVSSKATDAPTLGGGHKRLKRNMRGEENGKKEADIDIDAYVEKKQPGETQMTPINNAAKSLLQKSPRLVSEKPEESSEATKQNQSEVCSKSAKKATKPACSSGSTQVDKLSEEPIIGMRVGVRFTETDEIYGGYYYGNITEVVSQAPKQKKFTHRIKIKYDDGDEEETFYPDPEISLDPAEDPSIMKMTKTEVLVETWDCTRCGHNNYTKSRCSSCRGFRYQSLPKKGHVRQQPSGKWQARVGHHGKHRHIGVFLTQSDAELANKTAIETLEILTGPEKESSDICAEEIYSIIKVAKEAAAEAVNRNHNAVTPEQATKKRKLCLESKVSTPKKVSKNKKVDRLPNRRNYKKRGFSRFRGETAR